jgi:exocyst complex component 1
MEKMLSNWEGTSRKSIDAAYVRIVKSIFENLEAEAQLFATDKTNPEDKDHLNMHIITVENMHHFYSEVRSRKVPSLEGMVKQAKALYEFNLDAYCKFIIRKPLGKLLVNDIMT